MDYLNFLPKCFPLIRLTSKARMMTTASTIASSSDLDYDEKKQQYQIEIENFATYPARLLGVTRRDQPTRRGVRIRN